jgi:hypothetical protein
MHLLKKILLGFAGVIGSQAAKSQQLDLQSYAKEQKNLQRTGMYVLAGWAGANIISGVYFSQKTDGSAKYFHRMNAYWNIVNGGLAAVALWHLSKKDEGETFADVYKRQQSLEKVFLLNAGLDVAYIAAGAYLNEKGNSNPAKRNQWKGFGNSVALQGGFLLVFDGVMYTLMHNKGKKLEKVLEKVQLSSNGQNVSLLVDL